MSVAVIQIALKSAALLAVHVVHLIKSTDTAWPVRWLAAGLNNGSLAYNLPWNVTQPPKVPVIGRSVQLTHSACLQSHSRVHFSG